MKRDQIATLVLFLFCFTCLLASPVSGQTTPRTATEFRAERDAEFRNPRTSPLETWEVAKFSGLKYFEIDPSFKVRATFVRTPNEKKFNMPTSSGLTKVYLKYGELNFKVRSKRYKLGVYQSQALSQTEKYKNYLLIPFTDQTSGKETYGGGRYIDFEIPSSDVVTLDFNLAYNPSCAYSSRFNCPIPPRENRLTTKIKAGEKVYKTHVNVPAN